MQSTSLSSSPLCKLVKSLTALFCGLAIATAASGQVLITVDVTDPSLVIFTATGAAPSQDDSMGAYAGITLLGFLHTTSQDLDTGLSGDLQGSGTSAAYSNAFFLSYLSGDYSAGFDLNLYVETGGGTQGFTTGSAAFAGSSTLDLTSVSAFLPAAGASGSIQVGDGSSVGNVIGSYLVVSSVPEPSAYALLVGFAGAGFAGLRRRRGSR
jgi:hypothetical protein